MNSVVTGTKTQLDIPIMEALLVYLGKEIQHFQIGETHNREIIDMWENEAEVSRLEVEIILHNGMKREFKLKAKCPRTLADKSPIYEGWNPAKYELDLELMIATLVA